MIIHMYTSYGIITAVDIMENEKRMDTPYDPSIAIESYFDQIEDAVEFAEAGNSPFSTTQITTKAFIQMFATGLYKHECKAWNRLVAVSRTWATFKLIFTAAARELREMQVLTGNTRYANNFLQDLMDQTALALNTLATVTAEDRQTVANVASVNETVLAQLNRAIASLATIQARLSTLENRVDSQNGNGGGNRNDSRGGEKMAMENATALVQTSGTMSRTVTRMGAPAGTTTQVQHATTLPMDIRRRRRYQTDRVAAIDTAGITVDSGGRRTMN